MKKLLLLTTAGVVLFGTANWSIAADLTVKAPPAPVVVPLFTWTGFYIGGNIGAGWAQRTVTDSVFGATFGHSSDAAFIGGGQIGYNWQLGSFVFGVEGDVDGIAHDNHNATGVFLGGTGPFAVTSHNEWVSTLAARFGFAADHWLFYGKAGGGWVGASNFTIANLATGASVVGNNGNTTGGWMLGGGIEYAITNNWTVKGEYDYIGLPSRTFVVVPGSPFLVGDVFGTRSRNFQVAKIGFNYAFK